MFDFIHCNLRDFSVSHREGCPPYAPGLAALSKERLLLSAVETRVRSTVTKPGLRSERTAVSRCLTALPAASARPCRFHAALWALTQHSGKSTKVPACYRMIAYLSYRSDDKLVLVSSADTTRSLCGVLTNSMHSPVRSDPEFKWGGPGLLSQLTKLLPDRHQRP